MRPRIIYIYMCTHTQVYHRLASGIEGAVHTHARTQARVAYLLAYVLACCWRANRDARTKIFHLNTLSVGFGVLYRVMSHPTPQNQQLTTVLKYLFILL